MTGNRYVAQALTGGHELKLRDAVHGIDVVDAFDAVLIALMDGVDTDKAGAALRCRGPTLSDRHTVPLGRRACSRGRGAGCTDAPPRSSQALVAGVPEQRHRPLQQALRRRPRERAVQRIERASSSTSRAVYLRGKPLFGAL
jgi:hypothetical protein